MESHNFSIKTLAMDCKWHITRRYAWGISIILAMSSFISLLATSSKKQKSSSCMEQDLINAGKCLNMMEGGAASNPYLTMPNGELMDMSTPLTLYSSLFAAHEAIQEPVSFCEPELSLTKSSDFLDMLKPVSFISNPVSQQDNLTAKLVSVPGNPAANPISAQEIKQSAHLNELDQEGPKSAPLIDIESKIKANNLIGKIEANIDGIKHKFKCHNDVGAVKGKDGSAEKLEHTNDYIKAKNKVIYAALRGKTDGFKGKLIIKTKLDGFNANLRAITLDFQSKLRAKFSGLQANCVGLVSENWVRIKINLILMCCSSICLVSCFLCSSSSRRNEAHNTAEHMTHFRLLPVGMMSAGRLIVL